MKKLLLSALAVGIVVAVVVTVSPTEAASPYASDIYGAALNDGDVISANQSAGDPDIFIVKIKSFYGPANPGDASEAYNGFKRLFLNPAIFNMYGHLGGFSRVRQVTAEVRDSFVTSGLFRNCENGDQKVWATETTGEDDGILHHVQMTGDQAAAEDTRFFDKVFCINNREDNFYARSITAYYRLSDIPRYFRRGSTPSPYCRMQGQEVPSTGSGLCCPGLTQVPVRNDSGEVVSGMSSWMCAPSDCYYRQVYCIRAPCPAVLVCPSPSPIACAYAGQNFSTVYPEYPNRCCSGLTAWDSGFDTRRVVDGVCVSTGLLSGSPVGTCLNCGNGICENRENLCNCPADCR